jgi:hypothetical protein
MSMAFTSESSAASGCTSGAWDFYRRLARNYGWKPIGTRAPKRISFWFRKWDGGYHWNEGQWVTREDATAFADALEKNLQDPDRATRQRMVVRAIAAEVLRMAREQRGIELPDESEREPLPTDDDLRELISFCRKGSFRID